MMRPGTDMLWTAGYGGFVSTLRNSGPAAREPAAAGRRGRVNGGLEGGATES